MSAASVMKLYVRLFNCFSAITRVTDLEKAPGVALPREAVARRGRSIPSCPLRRPPRARIPAGDPPGHPGSCCHCLRVAVGSLRVFSPGGVSKQVTAVNSKREQRGKFVKLILV